MLCQVYKIHSDFYYVKNFEHKEFVCKIRDVLKKQKVDIRVGDFVELSEDNGFIVSLKERKNCLERPKVSNIDLAVVVASIKEPDLSLVQLNRYLAYLKYHKIDAVICFNKEDLINISDSDIKNTESTYKELGYKTFLISAKNNIGIDELKAYIKGKTIVLCGLSGVGKSTLTNAIIPDILIKTAKVSDKTQRGTHTTRHCEIIECDDIRIMDTPGFSRLVFDFLLPQDVIELFDDIKKFKGGCKYSNCYHNTEEKGICSIVDNLDKIDKERYKSYLTFLKEAMEYKDAISKTSIKDDGASKNIGHRTAPKISKRKREGSRRKINQNIREED